jgi:hypothetical protein
MPDERKAPPPLPPLPNAFDMPYQAVESWLSHPQNAYVEIRLTRGDLDRFFMAFHELVEAQTAFQQAMVDYTNNQLAEANEALQRSRQALIESSNNFRQFFVALMISAKECGRD